jgi:hypothetical protein
MGRGDVGCPRRDLVGRERDRAPPGFIRKSVLDRYNEFRPKLDGDTSADEPPAYEPATDVS